MDKIEALGEGFTLRKRVRKGARKKKKDLTFSSFIEEASEESSVNGEAEYQFAAGDLSEILQQISEAGDALKDSPTMENVRRYRGSVKAFIGYVLKRILKTEEKTSGINPLRKKRYVLIKIIDKKLEKLVVDVLQGQGEQLNILERVDEINGLVVDLVT